MAIGSEIGAFNLGFLTSGPRLFLPLSIGAVLLKQIFFFFFPGPKSRISEVTQFAK